MSRETLDTNPQYGNRDIPDGEHTFKVVSASKRRSKAGDVPFYVWKVAFNDTEGEQVLLPSMMGDLLRVLGCKEVSTNKFDWDTDEVVGLSFLATISRQPDKKDPSKIRQQMTGFKKVIDDNDIPF